MRPPPPGRARMDTLESILHATLVFVEAHKAFSVPVVFLLALGASVALLSLLFPATVVLVGIGAMGGAGAIPRGPRPGARGFHLVRARGRHGLGLAGTR